MHHSIFISCVIILFSLVQVHSYSNDVDMVAMRVLDISARYVIPALGFIILFFGYRLHRLACFFAGILTAGSITLFVFGLYFPAVDFWVAASSAAGAGFIFGIIFGSLPLVGYFTMGGLLGILMVGVLYTAFHIYIRIYILIAVLAIPSLILAVLGVIKITTKAIIITSTSFGGAAAICLGVEYFVNSGIVFCYFVDIIQAVYYIISGHEISFAIFLWGTGYAMFTGFIAAGSFGILIQVFVTGKNYTHDPKEREEIHKYQQVYDQESIQVSMRPLFIAPGSTASQDNRANQLNPNNNSYWKSRGYSNLGTSNVVN